MGEIPCWFDSSPGHFGRRSRPRRDGTSFGRFFGRADSPGRNDSPARLAGVVVPARETAAGYFLRLFLGGRFLCGRLLHGGLGGLLRRLGLAERLIPAVGVLLIRSNSDNRHCVNPLKSQVVQNAAPGTLPAMRSDGATIRSRRSSSNDETRPAAGQGPVRRLALSRTSVYSAIPHRRRPIAAYGRSMPSTPRQRRFRRRSKFRFPRSTRFKWAVRAGFAVLDLSSGIRLRCKATKR